MVNRTIAEDIRTTGSVLRDWLTPYYTLGGAVAFGIALLMLLDPSGWLVRGVAAILLLATALAWVVHLRRPMAPARPAGAAPVGARPLVKPHIVLLAITTFFLLGILLFEGWRAQQRASVVPPATSRSVAADPTPEPAAAAPDISAASAVGTAPATLEAPARAAAASGVVRAPGDQGLPTAGTPAVPAAAPTTPAEPAPVVSAVVQPAPAATRRRDAETPQPAPRRHAAPPAEPVSSPRSEPAAPVLTAQQRARCSELVSRFSLGEALQPGDMHYLKSTCH